jgi:hypothetical protein
MLLISAVFMILAFIVDTPTNLFNGFLLIVKSRSILITDYVEVGGLGAALLNVSIVGFSAVFTFIKLGVKPNGANIMAFWMSIGFAFFGKNVFNMIPLTIGVWLYAKRCKSEFADYYIAAVLVATVSPTISEIAFLGRFNPIAEIIAGILMGFFIGFIFPAISNATVKVHSGFNLYNLGFAGGLVATIITTVLRSMGHDVEPARHWSTGNNTFFSILLYTFAFMMLLMGIFSSAPKDDSQKGLEGLKERIRFSFSEYLKIHEHHGKLSIDYHNLYGKSVYINMAVLMVFATSIVLALGADLNGPTLAGILTMTGFGSLGKHVKNVAPIVIGAIISAYANRWDPTAPANILAILFSSGLAPFAGAFGPIWGLIAGFIHVNIAVYVGDLNGGLNLYNNGFAACFVVMFLLPIVSIFKLGGKYTKRDI